MLDNSRNERGPSLMGCILKSDNLSAGVMAVASGVATILVKDVIPFINDPLYASGMPNSGPRFLVDGAVAVGAYILTKIALGVVDYRDIRREGPDYFR